jgi:hypothetical protein
MSADNYLTIEREGDKWAVRDGCASNDYIQTIKTFGTRDEAIDYANLQYSEYGITYIEPIKGDK